MRCIRLTVHCLRVSLAENGLETVSQIWTAGRRQESGLDRNGVTLVDEENLKATSDTSDMGTGS